MQADRREVERGWAHDPWLPLAYRIAGELVAEGAELSSGTMSSRVGSTLSSVEEAAQRLAPWVILTPPADPRPYWLLKPGAELKTAFEAWRRREQLLAVRNGECKEAVLSWAYNSLTRAPDAELRFRDFLQDPASRFYRSGFTETEYRGAVASLAGAGLVEGFGKFGLIVSLLQAGRDHVERIAMGTPNPFDGYKLGAVVHQQNYQTNNFTGGGAAAQGPNSVAHSSVTTYTNDTRKQLVVYTDDIRRAAASLPPTVQADVLEVVDGLEADITAGADVRGLKGRLLQLKGSVADALQDEGSKFAAQGIISTAQLIANLLLSPGTAS